MKSERERAIKDAILMLKVLEGAIGAKLLPKPNSPCHRRLRKIIRALNPNGVNKPPFSVNQQKGTKC